MKGGGDASRRNILTRRVRRRVRCVQGDNTIIATRTAAAAASQQSHGNGDSKHWCISTIELKHTAFLIECRVSQVWRGAVSVPLP